MSSTDPVITRLLSIVEELSVWREAFREYDDPWEMIDGIRQRQDEEQFLNDQLIEANKKIAELESRTILDFIAETKKRIDQLERNIRFSQHEERKARASEEIMKSKLDMWAVLNK